MVPTSTVDQLETLNELFSQFCASDPELTENAKRAILFFAKESHLNDSENCLKMGVERLIELYFGFQQERVWGVEYWHVELEDYLGTLWLRNSLKQRLLRLAGYRESVFLITGLRAVVFKGHSYWSKACESEFRELKTWLESFVMTRVARDHNVRLLIV